MKIKFICFYPAIHRKNIFLSIENNVTGKSNAPVPLSYINNNLWETELEISGFKGPGLKYSYFTKEYDSGDVNIENDKIGIRTVKLNPKRFSHFIIKDFFEDNTNEKRLWESSLFTDILFNRNGIESERFRFPSAGKNIIEFNTKFVPINKNYSLGISGNLPELGMWDADKAVPLNGYNYPDWRLALKVKKNISRVEYKYVIINNTTGKVLHWETGNNHFLDIGSPENSCHCVINDNSIRFDDYVFRTAGVSIPVFSLKTKRSFGIGDFTDLKLFIDWAEKTRMKVIQILPVNDTNATLTFMDSYPYNTISVFALNPVYLNIFKMGKLKTKKSRMKYEQLQAELNSNYSVDYPSVFKYKIEYARRLFNEQEENIQKDKGFRNFISRNKTWLRPYALFCYLRDKHGTSDFSRWDKYSAYPEQKINKLTSARSEIYSDISFWYFVQYHLDKQLNEAANYAREKGIGLKGDLPIGVGRYSADTWSAPHLFNFDGQAGAPPDKFAVDGQNWTFPTYNWDEMEKDNYVWWQNRLKKMAEYFDAFRIDHILGFFRIWEIPYSAIQGILGHFNPALPFSREELQSAGIWVDTQRLCAPYIRENQLKTIFGGYADKVRKLYLNETELNVYELKDEYNTQRKIYDRFLNGNQPEDMSEEDSFIMTGLLKLAAEVVLLPADSKLEKFHPRVSMHSTYSYMELSAEQKIALDNIYINYYYHRHEKLWHDEALKKLPYLINASKMLVCGEDLGMIPSVVPEVMRRLNILSLEIQRMPKNDNVEFANPADAPYLSVCSTSTHDTSTIRGWWEEDRDKSQRFYNHQLGYQGDAPYFAEPWLCEEIINQHLRSPAMLAIFPLQDLLAMNSELRSDDTHNEQINIPSNPRHYWKYRMHLFVEDLLDANDFNRMINLMIKNSGRW